MKLDSITDLRKFCAEEMIKVRSEESTPAKANAMSSLAAKIVASINLEMMYNRMKGTVPNIDFMEKE